MTKTEALEILISSASADLRGQGLGLPPEKSEKRRKDIQEAIEKIWPLVYKRKMLECDKFNTL